ncbi:hypothetical protein AUP68_09905 [Ilyonectria robusta]
MPDLTLEEVEEKVVAAGEDDLPAMVWKQLWPVVEERVMHLFRTSLNEGSYQISGGAPRSSRSRSRARLPLKVPRRPCA